MAEYLARSVESSSVSSHQWQLVIEWRERVLPSARRLCRSAEDAEDVVHEALVRVAQHTHLDRSRVGSLLFTVVRHLSVDLHRRRQRESLATERMARQGSSEQLPEDRVCDREEGRHVRSLLLGLSARDRVLLQRVADGLTHQEIGVELALTRKATEPAIRRARNRARALIESAHEPARRDRA